MLGNTQKRIFLNVSEGKIVRKTDKGLQRFDFLEGILEKIYSKEREFRGEKVPYWYLDLQDPTTGDLYSLGLSATSGVWRSLILSLGSLIDISQPIRIVPYKRGDYDRVSVYSGSGRLNWISDLPPVEGSKGSPERFQSIQKRETLITELVSKVNERVGSAGIGSTELRSLGGKTSRKPRRSPMSLYMDDL